MDADRLIGYTHMPNANYDSGSNLCDLLACRKLVCCQSFTNQLTHSFSQENRPMIIQANAESPAMEKCCNISITKCKYIPCYSLSKHYFRLC